MHIISDIKTTAFSYCMWMGNCSTLKPICLLLLLFLYLKIHVVNWRSWKWWLYGNLKLPLFFLDFLSFLSFVVTVVLLCVFCIFPWDYCCFFYNCILKLVLFSCELISIFLVYFLQVVNNPCSNLLTAHFRLDGHPNVNFLEKVIQSTNQSYLFFEPSQVRIIDIYELNIYT